MKDKVVESYEFGNNIYIFLIQGWENKFIFNLCHQIPGTIEGQDPLFLRFPIWIQFLINHSSQCLTTQLFHLNQHSHLPVLLKSDPLISTTDSLLFACFYNCSKSSTGVLQQLMGKWNIIISLFWSNIFQVSPSVMV